MTMQLFDLAGADPDHRFSPYCWRVVMALQHKGLAYEAIPWRFSDRDKIAATGQGAVPVIVADGKFIHDSWTIANYLDERYPAHPLFGNDIARGNALLIKHWAERTLHPMVSRMVMMDIYNAIHERDKVYFRESREKRFGMTLEQWSADRETVREQFRIALEPVRLTVQSQAFISGATPAFADYITFGALQWARCVSPFKLLEADDPIYTWRSRVLELFGGVAGKAPARDTSFNA
ncbi:MAG: glutathione S-transferase family protein [Burkholderiales bacterium]